MEYLAVYEKEKSSVSLTRDEQMDGHLAREADIFCLDNGEMTLIATAKDGFLVERPVFPVTITKKIGYVRKQMEPADVSAGTEE